MVMPNKKITEILRRNKGLAGVAQWIKRWPANQKAGRWLECQSGHTPGLWAPSPDGVVREATH